MSAYRANRQHTRCQLRAPMSEEERAAVRKAGAQDARESRLQQGLPERVEDPMAVAVLTALLRAGRKPPGTGNAGRGRKPAA